MYFDVVLSDNNKTNNKSNAVKEKYKFSLLLTK